MLILKPHGQTLSATTTASTREVISSFATTKTLTSQPAGAKQTFLRQASLSLGVKPDQARAATPETTIRACLSQNSAMLQSTVTHQRDYYRQHANELHAMSMAMRDYCYRTYSTDGSGAPMTMPMGAH